MSLENHNHITRDIKPPGQCYSCDRYHATHGAKVIADLRNVIYGTLDSNKSFGHEHALSYLTQAAQARNIDHYEEEL